MKFQTHFRFRLRKPTICVILYNFSPFLVHCWRKWLIYLKDQETQQEYDDKSVAYLDLELMNVTSYGLNSVYRKCRLFQRYIRLKGKYSYMDFYLLVDLIGGCWLITKRIFENVNILVSVELGIKEGWSSAT